MISTQYPTSAEFEDAVHATAYMATALLRRGELLLPPRIREHIADGPVVVHLLRGEDDVARYEATLTAGSKLVGIDWPEDVLPQTGLTVLCPRGGASHDIGVVLPDANVDWPDADLPAAEPTPEPAGDEADEGVDPEDIETPDINGELLGSEPLDEPELWCDEHGHPALRCTYCDTTGEIDESGTKSEPVTDEQLAAITGALTAVADAAYPADEGVLPGPAEYKVPADLPVRGELELPADPWPGDEDLAAGENTEILTAVLVPATPDPTVDVEPGTVFSAALVAVRSPEPPKRRAGWLERRVREAARLVLDRSWTATRVIVATASGLVLAGAGLGHVVLAVFQ